MRSLLKADKLARFEAERQALTLMDHPNIAKVLDAGSTESGRPFFVMELVRGVKLTEYCDQNKALSSPENVTTPVLPGPLPAVASVTGSPSGRGVFMARIRLCSGGA
jgi:hypothetical protein